MLTVRWLFCGCLVFFACFWAMIVGSGLGGADLLASPPGGFYSTTDAVGALGILAVIVSLSSLFILGQARALGVKRWKLGGTCMGLIALVFGLSFWAGMNQMRRKDRYIAFAQTLDMREIERRCKDYMQSKNMLPPSDWIQLEQALFAERSGLRGKDADYRLQRGEDRWERGLVLRVLPDKNIFELYSKGSDGVDQNLGGDDIGFRMSLIAPVTRSSSP